MVLTSGEKCSKVLFSGSFCDKKKGRQLLLGASRTKNKRSFAKRRVFARMYGAPQRRGTRGGSMGITQNKTRNREPLARGNVGRMEGIRGKPLFQKRGGWRYAEGLPGGKASPARERKDSFPWGGRRERTVSHLPRDDLGFHDGTSSTRRLCRRSFPNLPLLRDFTGHYSWRVRCSGAGSVLGRKAFGKTENIRKLNHQRSSFKSRNHKGKGVLSLIRELRPSRRWPHSVRTKEGR